MNSAAVPTPVEDVQGDGRWLSMHNRFVSQAREMEPDVVFVGDSLVANLQSTDLWEKWFAPMHSLNFGIGGDQTQHVLWRLKNGELECIKPKAVVVLVGTNNHSHTAAEIAGGIIEICHTVREKQPQAYIIVLVIWTCDEDEGGTVSQQGRTMCVYGSGGIDMESGIHEDLNHERTVHKTEDSGGTESYTLLPRGEKPNPLREKNSEINGLIKEAVRKIDLCQVVNINRDLVLGDGTIDHRDMYDYLHLTWQGYRRAFEPVFELLTQLLHESDKLLLNDDTLASPASDNPPSDNPGTCPE